MGASGQIGKTLVAFTWKGLNVMRGHVVPANPRTQAQQDHRNIWKACVYVWRNTFNVTIMRTAWNLAALVSGIAQSGFNIAMQAMVKMALTNPDASFATTCVATTAYKANFTMKNIDDGATGDEAGDFAVWSGTAAGSLLSIGVGTITAGVILTPALGIAGGVRYVQIRKDDYARSGVCKITIAA
jgi:hypothetical protein